MSNHSDADLLKMISLVYRKMQIYLNDQTASLGLSCGQVSFIMMTCENGKMTQARFGELLDISKGTVAKTLAKLEEQGYVVRRENEKDGRLMDVYPTEKARAIYPQLVQIGQTWVEKMTTGMTEIESMVLRQTFQKISKNISHYF